MGIFNNKQLKQSAAELETAKKFALDWQRNHSKRPDPLDARWTRDNVCRANGHQRGKGC